MLDLLLITIFGCHLLAVDLAMAGPLVAIWLEWRATRHGDELAGRIGRRLAVWSLVAATVGVGLGLLAVAALPHFEPDAYRAAFGRVPSLRWWWAAAEVATYLVSMAAYVFLWKRWSGHRIWHRGLAVFAATNLMYHFPPLFTIISALSLRHDLKEETLEAPFFRKMLLDGEVLSRVFHHWLAGVAVTAGMAMVLAIRAAGALGRPAVEDGAGSGDPRPTASEPRRTADDRGRISIVRQAARIALMATMLQLPVGVWVLLALPTAVQNQVLGEDLTATLLFGLSIVAALGLMHHLMMISLGETSRRTVYRTVCILAAVVLLMVATLHRARQCVLEPARNVDSDFRLPTFDIRPIRGLTAHGSLFRLPTSDFRLPTSDFRLSSFVFRLSSFVFRLPTSAMPTITLIDPATGAIAKILPEVGFNCFSYAPVIDSEPVEVLWAAPGFEATGTKPMASGIPLLFPFAGRLRGTSFRYDGREFPLTIDERLGFAIHGFVYNRPWRVVAQSPASVTGEFHAAIDDPPLLDAWPADFRIRACYEVDHTGLSCSLTIDNPGDRPLPFGLGTHGYYRLPLGMIGKRDECHVMVPAASYWELVEMLPSGQRLPATDSRGLSDGMAFGATELDDVFTELTSRSGRVICRLLDPVNERRLSLVFDEAFRHCVVFNPPHRESICIEPYTCVPDAFSLTEQGHDTGLRVLQPGESFQVRIDLRLDEI